FLPRSKSLGGHCLHRNDAIARRSGKCSARALKTSRLQTINPPRNSGKCGRADFLLLSDPSCVLPKPFDPPLLNSAHIRFSNYTRSVSHLTVALRRSMHCTPNRNKQCRTRHVHHLNQGGEPFAEFKNHAKRNRRLYFNRHP